MTSAFRKCDLLEGREIDQSSPRFVVPTRQSDSPSLRIIEDAHDPLQMCKIPVKVCKGTKDGKSCSKGHQENGPKKRCGKAPDCKGDNFVHDQDKRCAACAMAELQAMITRVDKGAARRKQAMKELQAMMDKYGLGPIGVPDNDAKSAEDEKLGQSK